MNIPAHNSRIVFDTVPAGSYPSTIDAVAPEGFRVHLTAEVSGMRFYLDSFGSIPEGEKAAAAYGRAHAGKGVSYYLVDRRGNHSISGGQRDFAAHVAAIL